MTARKSARLLGAFCAAVLAVNAATLGAVAEGGEKTSSAPIFSAPSDAALYWATQVGQDKEMWSDAPSGLTVGDNGYLYICTADNICKIDKLTGKIANSGKMAGQATYVSKGPLYAEGRLFMALDGGTVQAFDADTLEPLWVYRNKLGGSPTCDIVFDGGCIFTGFWNGEEADADYVCIDVTDEDVSRPDEVKSAEWEYTSKGGFYWTTAAFSGDRVLVGTDNGMVGSSEDNSGALAVLERDSGKLVSRETVAKDDIRSKIVSADGAFYFTSRDGSIHTYSPEGKHSAYQVAEALGLSGVSCTSTPIAADGRVYMTLNGAGWDAYNGSAIVVLDEKRSEEGLVSFEVAYTLETAAACQAQGVFAGVDEDGNNVIYYVENGYPGNIRVLKDRAGLTEPLEVSRETDASGKVHECAPVIFTPRGEHANYCAVDPVFDPETGFIFVRNDSFNVLAIGMAESGLELVSPDNTIHPKSGRTLVYKAGEKVSDYEYTLTAGGKALSDEDVSFSIDSFAAEDDLLTVSYTYGLYTGDGSKAELTADIDVLIAETDDQYARALARKGDVDGDGKLTVTDISLVAAHIKGLRPLDKYSLNAADVNGNGQIDTGDITRIAAHIKNLRPITAER